MSREEFVERMEKRRSEKKETRNFILGLIALTAMSYTAIWVMSAIAFIH